MLIIEGGEGVEQSNLFTLSSCSFCLQLSSYCSRSVAESIVFDLRPSTGSYRPTKNQLLNNQQSTTKHNNTVNDKEVLLLHMITMPCCISTIRAHTIWTAPKREFEEQSWN